MLVASSSFSSFLLHSWSSIHSFVCLLFSVHTTAFAVDKPLLCLFLKCVVLVFFLSCRRNVAHCKDTELLDSLLDQQMCRQGKRTEWELNGHRSGVFVCDYVSLMFDVSFLLFVCGSIDSLPLSCSSWHPKSNIKHLWSALLLLI